jgi:4-hydroxybutyrate CoA-transferase
MDWTKIYESRVTSAQEAVKAVTSGSRIFLTGNVSVPQKLLGALADYAPNLFDVEICQALTIGPADYVKPELAGHLRVNTMFISANVRKAVQSGQGGFHPGSTFGIPPALQARHSPAGRRAHPRFPAG